MIASPASFLNEFRRDDRGGIMMIFGVMLMVIVMCAGVGIDFARVHHSYTRLATAADAAAIAAGKALLDGRNDDAAIQRIATEYFRTNFKGNEGYANVGTFSARIDRATNTISIDIAAAVPMTITQIAGFDKFDLPIKSVATFSQQDIEVGLALDVTGSMCSPCTKIAALKSATKDLLDILLPDAGAPNKVRVGFAPYSSGVNAGSYARDATNNRSTNGCTFERNGPFPEEDHAPGPATALKIAGDPGVSNSATCPAATVIGLSEDKALLKRTVDSYRTGGTTAGHLGAQWASYIISPHWGGVFGGESAAAPYRDGKTIKVAILMTDGENNSFGGYGNRPSSDRRAREICTHMRQEGVRVFTVGFALRDAGAIQLLGECAAAPANFFRAENEDELRAAFANIAQQINNLRLAK